MYQALTCDGDLIPRFNNVIIFDDFSNDKKHAVSFVVLVQTDGRFKNAAPKAMR